MSLKERRAEMERDSGVLVKGEVKWWHARAESVSSGQILGG
jgi:hypothetical protein